MAQMSKKLEEMLTEFMLVEIASKAIDGITYALLTNGQNDKEEVSKYKEIKNEVINCGFVNNQVFRYYKVSNGYIFDMDLDMARMLTTKITRSLAKNDPSLNGVENLIGDAPEKRRKKDLISLGRYIMQKANEGKYQIEVALFSRNTTNRIILTGKNSNGEDIAVTYNAYALRHWDMEILNEKILIPQGVRVSRIQPCEILPSKTGVSFILTLEKQ